MPPGSDTQLGVDEEGQFVIYTVLAIAAKNGQSALMASHGSGLGVWDHHDGIATNLKAKCADRTLPWRPSHQFSPRPTGRSRGEERRVQKQPRPQCVD